MDKSAFVGAVGSGRRYETLVYSPRPKRATFEKAGLQPSGWFADHVLVTGPEVAPRSWKLSYSPIWPGSCQWHLMPRDPGKVMPTHAVGNRHTDLGPSCGPWSGPGRVLDPIRHSVGATGSKPSKSGQTMNSEKGPVTGLIPSQPQSMNSLGPSDNIHSMIINHNGGTSLLRQSFRSQMVNEAPTDDSSLKTALLSLGLMLPYWVPNILRSTGRATHPFSLPHLAHHYSPFRLSFSILGTLSSQFLIQMLSHILPWDPQILHLIASTTACYPQQYHCSFPGVYKTLNSGH